MSIDIPSQCGRLFLRKCLRQSLKKRTQVKFLFQAKKASEIKELLLIIYPTKSRRAWKTITDENCYFLVKLADEYQMEDIREKCEAVLVDLVSKKPGNSFLADLTFAQTYKLEKLLETIVNKARQLRLQDLKKHEMYDKMDRHIYKKIVEGIIARLQTELEQLRTEFNNYRRGHFYR